ncbi:MAG: ATP-binding protein [Methylovulum sp.]|nr:ATP-binding protein [Methylovulum sp.]
MRAKSLSFRLLIAEGLVLLVFFALVAVVLEQGFRDSAEKALQERLQIQIYSLLAAAELDNTGDLLMPPSLPEPRFETPGSGLYGFIQQVQTQKKTIWRSPSAIGLDVISPAGLSAGNFAFLFDKQRRYALHYDVVWQTVNGTQREYIVTVEEDARFVSDQVEQLQKTLRLWLLAIGIALISIQFALLRWSLAPLRSIAKDLAAIEQGQKTHLDGQYPSELQGLVGNLNAFISIERAHLERYRNNLADLAHSLKTPLAILRGCLESFNAATVKEQISRMDEIVEYQLHRAAAKGEQKAIKTVDLSVIINKITASLNKVYIDKNINFDINIPDACLIYCEEGDLYEIVGNLMDNACKWCRQEVKVSIYLKQRKARRDFSVLLEIEDDGPGIPVGKFNEILKRGVRADENINGHGIGMTVVYELIGLLNGKLEGGKSDTLGGMRWSIYLP